MASPVMILLEHMSRTSVVVLPALVNEFEAVAVRVLDLCGIVSRIIMKLGSRGMKTGCAGAQSRLTGFLHHGGRLRDKADMDCTGCWRSLSQPEEHTPFGTKPFQVWMAGWSILSIVIKTACDSEAGKHGFVESDRTVDIAHRQKDMIEHGKSQKTLSGRNFDVLANDPKIVTLHATNGLNDTELSCMPTPSVL